MRYWMIAIVAALTACQPQGSDETAATSQAKQPAEPAAYKSVEFNEDTERQVIDIGKAKVTIQRIPSDEYDYTYTAAIQLPGHDLLMTPLEAYGSNTTINVRYMQLEPDDPGNSIMIESWTGGAHCCLANTVFQPTPDGVRQYELPQQDGNGSFDQIPNDINGDGYADLVTVDPFDYSFSSYAGSYSPPKIYNVFRGKLVDVSREPGFRPLFQKFADTTKVECNPTSEERNGACIAYLAAMAVLGKLEEGKAYALQMADSSDPSTFPEGCAVERTNYECPMGQEIRFGNFGQAADWFLKDRGYIG